MFRFGLFGIPVTVQWWFWLMAAILGRGILSSPTKDAPFEAVAWFAAIFITVLWHELGHALLFRWFGFKPSITLWGLGGYASASKPPAHTLKQRREDILISLAGPGANFLLWGVLFFLLMKGIIPVQSLREVAPALFSFLYFLLYMNLVLAIINLIPIYPLDGGQILFSAMGSARRQTAFKVTIGVGVALIIYLIATGQSYNAMFVGILTMHNYQRFKGQKAGYGPFR